MGTTTDSPGDGPLRSWWVPDGEARVFELPDWPDPALEALRTLLGDEDVPHRWDDGRLVVDAAERDRVIALVAAVVEASLPRFDPERPHTVYELGDWPDEELEMLEAALADEGVVHAWTDDADLLVYDEDESFVDELFDRLGLHGPESADELTGEALTDLLTALFVAADRLARSPGDASATLDAHRSASAVVALRPPYGIDPVAWGGIVDAAGVIVELVERDAADDDAAVDDDDVAAAATRVREELRPLL